MNDPRPGDNFFHRYRCGDRKDQRHPRHDPNESWDRDEVSPPILVEYQRNGKKF